MKKYLGIDVGGMEVKYLISDDSGNVETSGSLETSYDIDQFCKDIIGLYDEFNFVDGVGISIPGFIHFDKQYIEFGGALTFLNDTFLVEKLSEYINVPIVIDNDSNCAALCEKWIGNAQNLSNFFCITIGTGIGAGIFINDHIFRGAHYRAGEMGFTIVNNHERKKAIDETMLSNVAAVRPLVNRISNELNLTLNGKDIMNIKNENSDVKKIYDEWIFTLATGLYNHIYSLDPECVLIGGGISANKQFMSDLSDALIDVHPETLDRTKIIECKYLNNAGALGAIYLLKDIVN